MRTKVLSIRIHIRALWIFVAVFLILAAAVGVGTYKGWQVLKPLYGDLALALVASERAGPRLPFDEDFSYLIGNEMTIYGQLTNSPYLVNKARLIIPYFAYEKVAFYPRYPFAIGFGVYEAYRSFHVGGTYYGQKDLVLLNERYVLDSRWDDHRDVLTTLVHELIHAQGGKFLINNDVEDLESRTQAATIEVLASMCNYGDDLACLSFWEEIEGLARVDMKVRLHEMKLDWVYELTANVLFRDRIEDKAAFKQLRFWADNQEEYWYIIRAYSLKPWGWIKAGLRGIPLDTGIVAAKPDDVRGTKFYYLGMPFDDTKVLLGWLTVFVNWTR
jgi:hypothetical protein